MSAAAGRMILRFGAVFLGVASATSVFVLELPGIGLMEGHLLAFVVAMLLLRAHPALYAQLTAAVVQASLGTAHVLFWGLFLDAGFGVVGVVLISLNFLFAVLHLLAAAAQQQLQSIPGVTARASRYQAGGMSAS